MSLLDRIRSLLSAKPQVGKPGTGALMDRSGGEFDGPYDDARKTAHPHDLGAPNDPITDHVRPPMQ